MVWLFKGDRMDEQRRVFSHPAEVNWCSFSPDGKWLATACTDKNIRLFSLNGSRPAVILSGHTKIANVHRAVETFGSSIRKEQTSSSFYDIVVLRVLGGFQAARQLQPGQDYKDMGYN